MSGNLSIELMYYGFVMYPIFHVVDVLIASTPVLFVRKLFEFHSESSASLLSNVHIGTSIVTTLVITLLNYSADDFVTHYLMTDDLWMPGMVLYSAMYGLLLYMIVPSQERLTNALYDCKLLVSMDDDDTAAEPLLEV